MALLQINWESRTSVAPDAAATGRAATEEDAQVRVSDKPLFVFVTADDPENDNMRKLQDVVFANEKLAIGTKFFRTVRISAAEAARDRVLKDAVDGAPCLVFLRRDYTVHSVINEHQLSAGKILSAMGRLVRETFENNFDRTVGDYVKLLNEQDQLESLKARLQDQKTRYADRPGRLKKVEQEEAEYEKEVEAWRKKHEELLNFKLRGAKDGNDATS